MKWILNKISTASSRYQDYLVLKQRIDQLESLLVLGKSREENKQEGNTCSFSRGSSTQKLADRCLRLIKDLAPGILSSEGLDTFGRRSGIVERILAESTDPGRLVNLLHRATVQTLIMSAVSSMKGRVYEMLRPNFHQHTFEISEDWNDSVTCSEIDIESEDDSVMSCGDHPELENQQEHGPCSPTHTLSLQTETGLMDMQEKKQSSGTTQLSQPLLRRNSASGLTPFAAEYPSRVPSPTKGGRGLLSPRTKAHSNGIGKIKQQ